jgi:hypothetical protein
MDADQLFRNTRAKILAIASQRAAEKLGLDLQARHRTDDETVRQWHRLRDQYVVHALDNLSDVLAGLSTMDLDDGHESPAPPACLR